MPPCREVYHAQAQDIGPFYYWIFFLCTFLQFMGNFLVSLWCMSKDVSSLQVVISLLFFNPDALIEATEGMVEVPHCSLRLTRTDTWQMLLLVLYFGRELKNNGSWRPRRSHIVFTDNLSLVLKSGEKIYIFFFSNYDVSLMTSLSSFKQFSANWNTLTIKKVLMRQYIDIV